LTLSEIKFPRRTSGYTLFWPQN